MYLEPTRSGVFNIVQLHSEESRETIFTRITKKVKKTQLRWIELSACDRCQPSVADL